MDQKLCIPMSRRKLLRMFGLATASSVLVRQSWGQSSTLDAPQANLAGQWQFTPNPALPNVLLIGDSISIGYTLDVRRHLQGKANVFRPMKADGKPENGRDTNNGLQHIQQWLGGTPWSVIHFNWGLWDLCYRGPNGRDQDKVHGMQDVPIAQYRKNLDELVQQLRRTKASLIWAATTVIPPDEPGRFAGDEVKYNQAAAEIMHENHIRIDDLYSLTSRFTPDNFLKPGNVHYTHAAYERIADQVASVISDSLRAKQVTAQNR